MLLTFAEFAEGIQLEWYLRKFILFPTACNCSRDDQKFSLMIPCPFFLKIEIHSKSKLKIIYFFTKFKAIGLDSENRIKVLSREKLTLALYFCLPIPDSGSHSIYGKNGTINIFKTA